MPQGTRGLLETLKFELQFLEDGGYGRSPRTSWRATYTFEDSPTCLNSSDPSRPHLCAECRLMQFVPEQHRREAIPCRFIPLIARGDTIDCFYRCATQAELEEALISWLRKEIARIEAKQEKRETASQVPSAVDLTKAMESK